MGVEAKDGVYMNGSCAWVGMGELEVVCVRVMDKRVVRSLCNGQGVMFGNLMRCGL